MSNGKYFYPEDILTLEHEQVIEAISKYTDGESFWTAEQILDYINGVTSNTSKVLEALKKPEVYNAA